MRYTDATKERIERDVAASTAELIDGFEFPFGMDLLAKVDWLLSQACISDRSCCRSFEYFPAPLLG